MVKEKEYYDVLGVKPDCKADDITKAYRELAKKLHPDKPTGDAEKFKALKAAYEVLKDPKTRATYDKHGKKGLEKGAMMDDNPFASIFNPGGNSEKPTKGEALQHVMKLTLEQLYTGVTKKLAIRRQTLCSACSGYGGPKEKRFHCKPCKGRGQVIQLRQIGPGMMQQIQAPCDACNGQGEGFEEKDKCQACSGKGTISTREVVEVHIPAGTEHNKHFTFYEKGDEAVDMSPGDLVVTIQQEPHPTFQRRGANLFMKKTLSLFQALTGFEFQLIHLDGHKLTVKSKPGGIVPPGTVQVVRGQGMPLGIGTQTGDLYFEYDVEFPKSLNTSEAEKQTLAKVLGHQEQKREVITAKQTASVDEDTRMEDEDVFVEDVDLTEERQRWQEQQEQAKRKHGATEEDEDEGPRGTQCRAQ